MTARLASRASGTARRSLCYLALNRQRSVRARKSLTVDSSASEVRVQGKSAIARLHCMQVWSLRVEPILRNRNATSLSGQDLPFFLKMQEGCLPECKRVAIKPGQDVFKRSFLINSPLKNGDS